MTAAVSWAISACAACSARLRALWDLHEMGFILQGLVSDWELFGEKRSLEAARRAADYIMRNWASLPDGWEFNFIIKKANNPLSMAGKTATVKWDKLKKKAQTLKVSKVIKFKKKGQGEMRYKLTSAKKGKKSFKKYFKVAAKNGKVTVKKGLEKGTFKVKVKVKAGGTANYKASKWKSVTFKVKVR